jgi:hypothetical protein
LATVRSTGFAEDVLAGLGRSDDEIGVRVGRRADDDRVEALVGEQGLRALRDGLDAESLGPRFDFRRQVDVGHGPQPGLRDGIGDVLGVDLADAAGADDADVQERGHTEAPGWV